MRAVILAAREEDVALATTLASEGHTIHVLRPVASHEPPEPARIGRLTITSVGEYPPMIPTDDELSRVLQLNLAMLHRGSAVLSEMAFDVVHASTAAYAYAGTAFGRLFDRPLVTTLGPLDRRKPPPVQQMSRWLAVQSSMLIVRSRQAAWKAAETYGVDASRIAVVAPSRAGDHERRLRSVAERTARVYEAATSTVLPTSAFGGVR